MPRHQQYPAQQATPFISQYTPQYDPAMQQMMLDTIRGRQERYDQGAEMVDQSIAQFGSVSSIYPEVMQQRLGEFRGELDEIASEYGGDYGMAIGSLRRKIAEEASNPLYQRQAQIAEFAKEERAAIQKAGGIQNVFLPQGSVGSRAYDPDAPLSSYQSMVVPQDDFMGIIDDISKNIKPSLVQMGLSQTEAEKIVGLIRDNQVSGLSRDQLKAVASVAYDSFMAAAPSIQYSPEDHWTRNKEQTVDIMLSRWAGLHMTGDEHRSRLMNMPTQPTPEEVEQFYTRFRYLGADTLDSIKSINSKYSGLDIGTETVNMYDIEKMGDVMQGRFMYRELLNLDIPGIDSGYLNKFWTGDINTNSLTFDVQAFMESLDDNISTSDRVTVNRILQTGEEIKSKYTQQTPKTSKGRRDQFFSESPLAQLILGAVEDENKALEILRDFELDKTRVHYGMFEIPRSHAIDVANTIMSNPGEVRMRGDSGRNPRTYQIDSDGTRSRYSKKRVQDILAEVSSSDKNFRGIHVIPATGEIVLAVTHDNKAVNLVIPAEGLYTDAMEELNGMLDFLTELRNPKSIEGGVDFGDFILEFQREVDPDGRIVNNYYRNIPIREGDSPRIPMTEHEWLSDFLEYMISTTKPPR